MGVFSHDGRRVGFMGASGESARARASEGGRCVGGVEIKDVRLGPALRRSLKVVRGRDGRRCCVSVGGGSVAVANWRTGMGFAWCMIDVGVLRHLSLGALDAMICRRLEI